MRKAMALLLAILLSLPFAALGEGSDVPVEAFIERAGIEADAALRQKIEDFLKERYITAPLLSLIDDARIARYASHLSNDLPIAYPALTQAGSGSMPEGARVLQLAVIVPRGAEMETMLADFERGLVYYDESFPLIEDVCRAAWAGALSDADAAKLLAILGGMPLEDQVGEMPGVEFGAIRVIVAWDGGAACCMAAGDGISEDFMTGVQALLEAGYAAARGGEP